MENRGVLRVAVTVSTDLTPLLGARPAAGGVVVSVHRSAVNVVIGRRLATLASARGGGLPNGVLVAEPFDPSGLGIRAGMTVLVGRDGLSIPEAGVRIATRAARRWRPEIRPLARPADLSRRLALARAALSALPPTEVPFHRFGRLIPAGSGQAIGRAGRTLVGLGPGLTPSGDDYLVGFTAGLAAIGDPRARWLATAWADFAIGRTTLVAEAFHAAAAAGAYAERLHDASRAVLAGPPAGIPAAVRTAAAWGATSGRDTLAGLLLGLEAGSTARVAAA